MSDSRGLLPGDLDKPKIAGVLLVAVFLMAIMGAGEVFLFDWDAFEMDPLPEDDPKFELDGEYEEYLNEGEIDENLLRALNENITAEEDEISENATLSEGDDIWWVEEDEEEIYGIEVEEENEERVLKVYDTEEIDEGLIETIFNICGAVYLVIGGVVLIGAICAFKRIYRKVAIGASVLGIFSLGPFFMGSILSVIALVLVLMAREEFAT